MFKNLSTSTKLILLCSAFIVAIAVGIYGLVAEKMIAIEFARKELIGDRYLETVRTTYKALLTEAGEPSAQSKPAQREIIDALALAESEEGSILKTAEAQQALAMALADLWSAPGDGKSHRARFLAALAAARKLALRIGDGSNLTLDPDIDSYYLQNMIVSGMPAYLEPFGELQALASEHATSFTPTDGARLLFLEDFVRSTLSALKDSLASASSVDPTGNLMRTLGPDVERMIASAESYLSKVGKGAPQVNAAGGAESGYATALEHAFVAWGALQSELDRLLRKRIDTLLNRLYGSLALTGALACLGIAIALLTYRHIAGPLGRLAGVARTVQETKDYSLRAGYSAKDEIGQLASAFNGMMSELAAARGREAADQARATALHAELARVARLKTMGAMAASIAHEISQPLGAIVANGSAGLRWLAHAVPNLDETRAALTRIVADGHRAGNVIKSVRTMVKAERGERAALATNDLIEEILGLVRSELWAQQILIRTELGTNLPDVVADRVQLQQVLLNLVVNAAEAMASITDRPRTLDIRSDLHDDEKILVTVADSGPGIDPQHGERIFDAFFSTKPSGMGMGLSICRSIVESHGGRLWVSPGSFHGTIFHVLIPINADQA